MSRVAAHREANKAIFARDGVNLTFTAYFIAAIVPALKHFPMVNSVFNNDSLIYKRDINIGMAVSLDKDGLIVPILKHADEKSLLALARDVNDLANRARNKQLKPDETQGGTFTLTNHGISGSLFATPIINQPQCGILGVGAIQKRVVVINDAIAIRPMVYLSFSFDHRILDGATADYFVAKIKEALENWN
jgi:2-oxoglutarate dehydrogenase E2 component (dihydrolipoamide succinyltransferase)